MNTLAKFVIALLSIPGFGVLTGCLSVFPPAFPPPSDVTIQTTHQNWYIIAQDQDDNWSLRQRATFDECGRFTMYELPRDEVDGNRTIALKTCHNRYVTVPRGDLTRPNQPPETRRDRMAWQETRAGDCAQFTLVEQGDGTVAFKTCGGGYLTAGDAGVGWEDPLKWAIVVENATVDDWERFTLKELP